MKLNLNSYSSLPEKEMIVKALEANEMNDAGKTSKVLLCLALNEHRWLLKCKVPMVAILLAAYFARYAFAA